MTVADRRGRTPQRIPWTDAPLRWIGHQRWLRFGVRDRLLRFWRDPESIPPRSFEVDFAGLAYPGDLSRWIDWLVYYTGAYEIEELELLARCVKRGEPLVALDVGANVGHHTLYFASLCEQVHAFEPFEPVARFIDEKIVRNGLRNVVVHPVGLSDCDESLPYFPPGGANVGNGTFVAALSGGRAASQRRLELRAGDAYVESLGLERVDIIKMDVEGFEPRVLAGLRQTMRRYRPVVMLELSDSARASVGSRAAFVELLPTGYRIDRILPARHRLVVFSERDAGLGPFDWDDVPTRGGYVNLLLRPSA